MVATIAEHNLLIFLIQFFILLGSAKGLGLLFAKIKQPTITSDMLVGVILGPTILGRLFPGLHAALFPRADVQIHMFDTVAWVGILLLLLVTGLEVNFSSVLRQRGAAVRISAADIVFPILISGIPIFIFADRMMDPGTDRLLFTLFLATIMTISAMPVAIRAMRDLGFLRTDLGFLVISALSINDIVGWLIFTIILGLFTHGSIDFGYIATIAAATLGFTGFALTVGRTLIARLISLIKRRSDDDSAYALTAIALLGLLFGAITTAIGIHALFGFFIAGLIAGEARDLSERTRGTISQMVYAIFVPLFFVNIGIKIDILEHADLPLFGFILIIGVAARLVGAHVGSRFARTARSDRWIISVLHTPGGEMHIVISTLAYEFGLINTRLYIAIIGAAVASSIILGPWLSWLVRLRARVDIAKILRPEGILPDLGAATRREAIAVLCRRAADLSGADADAILESVLRREEQMPTSLGEGIARPHGRIEGLDAPLLLLGREPRGIEWDAPDGRPVRLIFLILTPADAHDAQMRISQAVAKAARADEVRQGLLAATDAGEMAAAVASARA
ncbi:MAG: cation:proton antiporter [Planctomycetes bacterium]|nr:cation:proton antiporter [Planctomycetota bacterium]